MSFPSQLFQEIKLEKQNLHESFRKLVDQIQKEERSFPAKIEELNNQKKKAINDERMAQEKFQNQETERLQNIKMELIHHKNEMESEIKKLEREINEIESSQHIYIPEKELILLKSIAPVSISSSTPNHISGTISLGTPETTESFDYDYYQASNVPKQFWAQLDRCYKNLN